MKILIVDDAPDIRAWLKILLEKAGWEVEQACTGAAASRILESSDIRIVITDWLMPDMDGIQLIDWIRTRHAKDYIYTILMTSLDQEEDCVKGLSCGADDFLTKPASPSVLYARLSVAMRILSFQQDLLAQQEQLRESRDLVTRAYALVQEDLKGASAAQRSLLPVSGRLSNTVETAWLYQPAMGVSGDYLDIFTIGEEKLVFYLLDVSGHGITAALRSAAISQLMRPISGLMDGMDTKGPAHVMERLNRHLCEGNSEMDYLATMVLGDFDAAKGILRFVSAGHPPPLVLAEDEKARSIDGGGIPLGIDPGAKYSDMETLLKPGEMVLLYSDGLLESENGQGEQLGLNALGRNVEMDAHLAPAEMLASLENWRGKWTAGRALVDDVSALALKFSSECPATHPVNKELPQRLHSMTDCCSLSLTSDPGEIELLLETLDAVLEKSKLGELPAFRFRCAVIEVVNNCIRHAYMDEPGHPINITIQLQADHLTLVVRDRGPVFTGPVGTPQSDPFAESGRGFEIINAGVCKVNFSHQDGWNSCQLEVNLT